MEIEEVLNEVRERRRWIANTEGSAWRRYDGLLEKCEDALRQAVDETRWRELLKEKPQDFQQIFVTVYDNDMDVYEVRTAVFIKGEGYVVDHGDEGDFTVMRWKPMPKEWRPKN